MDHFATALLYHKNGEITRNYVDKNNIYRMQLPYFVHEQKHNRSYNTKYRTRYKYAPMEYTILCMYEEITANIEAILTADLEYQLADDKASVIEKYENTYMKFYFDAIKDSSIKPESKDQNELDKKYDLLVNGTINMWQQKYRAHYTPSVISNLTFYIKNLGIYDSCPRNFKKIRSLLFTFGGVDLSKYVKQEATHNDIRFLYINDINLVKSFRKNRQLSYVIVQNILDNYGILPNFSPAKRKKAFQHLFVAAKLKYELEKLGNYSLKDNKVAINAAYNKVMYELAFDSGFHLYTAKNGERNIACIYVDNCHNMAFNIFAKPELLDEKDCLNIRKFYTFQNQNLIDYIKNFDFEKLPIEQNNWMDLTISHYLSSNVDELIIPFYDKHDANDSGAKDASVNPLNNQADVSVAHTMVKRRLSDEQYIDVPDWSQPLLVPGALSEEQIQELKDMFKAFDDIPSVFKNCDEEQKLKYIQMYGNPHYFDEPGRIRKHYQQKQVAKEILATRFNAKQK